MAKFTLRILAGLMFVVSVFILSQTSARAQAIITKGSVTPTTYSGPGQTLQFTFVFNSGNRVITSFSMTNNSTNGAYSCTPGSVSTNANITCTYNYVTTALDSFPGGSVSDVPNYSYNSGLGSGSYNPGVFGQVVANYVAPPTPTVSSISPTSGPGNGGTAVTITGTNFVGVTGVSIGGSPATGVVVNSATQISAFTGAHAPAAGLEVDVSNGGGTNTSNTLFTYTAGTCSAGGSGTLSMSGTAVNTNQFFSIDTVLANPASVEGTSGVFFTCGADTSFYAPDQAGAPDAGGPITGLSGGVYNLAYDVTNQAADDAALRQPHYVIKVITPPPAGTDSLTLYYNGSALPDGNFGLAYTTFTLNLTNVVTGGPTLTAVSPASGPTAGGTVVTITGTKFSATPASNTVKFGTTAATVTAATTTSLTVTSPPGSAGVVDITVQVAGVTSGTSVADQFTYVAPPVVTTNPSNSTVTAGSNASFTAAASGTTPTVQWQVSTGGTFSNLSDGVVYSGSSTGTLSITGATTGMNGYKYQAIFTNGAGTATTSAATLTVNPGPATHFTVAAPSTTTSGAAINATVTAYDQFNNVATGYTGTVHFTSSDGAAVLPANSTLTNGTGTFSVTYKTTGNQTLVASDTVTSSINGTTNVSVVAGAATHFTVTAPANATAGTAISATVTAFDLNNNVATGYAGTVHFTSSDGAAVLPANSTLTNGTGTFSVTYKTTGNQTLVASDTVTSSINGTTNVSVVAGAVTHFTVTAPANATAGTAVSATVTAFDLNNNVATSYTGTVHFTSSDGASVLPANATLTNGTGTFSVTYKTAGTQTLTATDAVTSAITGVSGGTVVSAGAPAAITVSSGSVQSAPILTTFTNPLGALVKDAYGNVVPNATVTFTAPSTLASVTFASGVNTATTNTSGVATSAAITANGIVGGFNVVASSGAATTASFALTNTPGTQTLSFTSTAPAPATALGATYTPVAVTTAAALENLNVAITVDAASSTVCSINGAGVVSFLTSGTCKLDANQAGDANYLPATQVQQSITVVHAAQTIVFTSTPPAVVAAGGSTYTVAATATSGLAVTFSIDAASGAGVCSIAGSTVSFLTSGTCIVDANQAGNGSYAAAAQKQQTILVQNGVGPTVTAIGGFLADRNNAIVTNLWNMDGTIDRLNDAPGGAGPGAGLADQDQPASQPPALLGGHALASQDRQYGTAIPAQDASSASLANPADAYGLQQMVYSALRQLGETQSVNQLNYSGPFSAQMSTSGDMTGTFHTSLSQIMKWNDQAQQKEAASMGLNTSASAHAHQFNPLDVWMQGTYAAVNSTQQSKFGLLSSGVDYVFNRNLLLGFYGQVDFMNQTTGLQAAGTGWMVGPYGTMRLSDQVFLEARGGYGRSSNSMTDALDPTLIDQFGSTRWLASAALAGRWQFGDHITFKPNFGFTYFTDSTDAYVNGLSVSVPSVTSQLGQFKFSPEVTKGFSLGDANWFEASIAPELIYNFTSTTADGLGSLDPTATGPQGLRGAIKWGVSMKTPSGLTIATQGSYDGIGSSGYSAVTASARLNVPLN